MLACWSESGNVIVVARLLRQFTQRDHAQRDIRSHDAGEYRKNRESYHRDKCSENHSAKRGHFLREHADGDSQRNHDDRSGSEHAFGVRCIVNVVVHIKRKGDEFLPVDNPEARKNQQEKHELRICEHLPEVAQSFRGGSGLIRGFLARLLEKEQHAEEHGKYAESRYAKDIFHAQMLVHPRSHERTECAANIHECVIDGISDGADVFMGRARSGADHARFDQSNAEGRKHQNNGHQ